MNLNDIRTGFLIQHYIYKKSCWRDSMLDYFPGCTKILTKISKSKKGDNLHQKPTRVTCPCCLQPHECYGIVSSQYKWWLQRYTWHTNLNFNVFIKERPITTEIPKYPGAYEYIYEVWSLYQRRFQRYMRHKLNNPDFH